MDPRYHLLIPVPKPETADDHQRNLQEQALRFNSLPYGSGVFKVEQPTDPRYYPANGPGFNNQWIQPEKVVANSAPCRLVDERDSPFTTVLDNFLLIEEGGWWEFTWTTQHIAPAVNTICGVYLAFEQSFSGYPFPPSYSTTIQDFGNQAPNPLAGDWPIHNQRVLRLVQPGTRVRPVEYHSAGNLSVKVLSFTARLVLSE